MKYYPAFLSLKDKQAVVVGGGRVAERKVRLLISAGASVKLISPDITANLCRLKQKGLLEHIKRHYKKGDLKGAFIVIAGTSSAETNSRIASEARHLVNVIDAPSEGNFIVPSMVRRGPLTIAVSTEGASPALSKTIRKELEDRYRKDFASYLRFIESVRKKAIEEIRDKKKREKFLRSLASDDILSHLRSRGIRSVRKHILSSLKKMK